MHFVLHRAGTATHARSHFPFARFHDSRLVVDEAVVVGVYRTIPSIHSVYDCRQRYERQKQNQSVRIHLFRLGSDTVYSCCAKKKFFLLLWIYYLYLLTVSTTTNTPFARALNSARQWLMNKQIHRNLLVRLVTSYRYEFGVNRFVLGSN